MARRRRVRGIPPCTHSRMHAHSSWRDRSVEGSPSPACSSWHLQAWAGGLGGALLRAGPRVSGTWVSVVASLPRTTVGRQLLAPCASSLSSSLPGPEGHQVWSRSPLLGHRSSCASSGVKHSYFGSKKLGIQVDPGHTESSQGRSLRCESHHPCRIFPDF